jgi:outer membrane lipoprotein carrier protein
MKNFIFPKKSLERREKRWRKIAPWPLAFLFLLTVEGIGSTPGECATLSQEEVVTKVQEQYDRHSNFKAHFVQESWIKSLGRKQMAEGLVYFKKPGGMRWTYQKPTKQEIISDGQTLWQYRPEDNQVVVSKTSQAFESKTPSTFLMGIGNLKQDFQARFVKEPSPGSDYTLELTPLETQGSMEKLFLTVDRKTFKILQAKIQDVMGNITQISFSKIQFDTSLPDDLFAFIPPKGVEVFNMPGAAEGGAGK